MSGVGTSFALPVSVDLSHEFWLVDMRASTSLIEEKREEESGRERGMETRGRVCEGESGLGNELWIRGSVEGIVVTITMMRQDRTGQDRTRSDNACQA